MRNTTASPQETQPESQFPLIALLIALALFLAWPAVVLGLSLGFWAKRRQVHTLVWLGLACLGLCCLWLLCLYVGYVPLLQAMVNAIPPFYHWNRLGVWGAFLPHLIPLWIRSLLLTPVCALSVHLFPKGMEEELLSKERDRLTKQERASQRAKRRLRDVPDQIEGKAVLGAIIQTPR